MTTLYVGMGRVSIFVRHSRSLKDKRQVVQHLIQKLRNEGFSAVEFGYNDDHKRASIGFSYAGKDPGHTEDLLYKAKSFFIGDYMVVDQKTEIVEMGEEIPSDSWQIEEEP